MSNATSRNIALPTGDIMEVWMTDEFESIVRNHFQLTDEVEITDEHVRMFFYGAVKNAVDKAEETQDGT